MQIIKKNWFDFYREPNHVLLWTCNTTITSKGTVVMGRGLAKELSNFEPAVKQGAAKIISAQPQLRTDVDPHGNKVTIHEPKVKSVLRNEYGAVIAMFPVKYGWWEAASLEIIEDSAKQLRFLARMYKEQYTFVCNFPGIGAGRLEKNAVMDVLNAVFTDRDTNVIFLLKEV